MNAVREWRQWSVRHVLPVAAIGCLAVSAPGCRSGSWVSKPSWMTFGQKAEDAGPLSSAPAFAGDVPKPSATAQPYPTTSTPEGYSLPDATAQAATAPGAAPAAVTYGSTPPPAAVAAAPTSSPSPTTSTAIAPQVGPYAATSPATPVGAAVSPTEPSPPAWSTPALAAVPPTTAAATTASTDPAAATVSTAPPPWASGATSPPAASAAASPPQRYADARAASPAWTPAPLDGPPITAGRYAESGTSRFSTGAVPAAASMLPATPPELQPATAAPATLPVPASDPATPAAPVRRPDPGYRPGGTSSYRPARATLGGDAPAGVQPVSFQAGAALPQ